jgi:chitodextrinase
VSAAASKERALAAATLAAFAMLAIFGPAGGASPSDRDEQAPSRPANVRVTSATASSVAVAWDPSTDNVEVTAYELSGDLRRTRLKDPSYIEDRLACGRSLSVWITALDRAGNRSEPAQATVSTSACRDTTPPTPPSGFRQSATTQNAVVLVWDASSDDTGVVQYGVYRNGLPLTSVSEPAVTLSGLSCGSTTEFAVDASDAAGNRSERRSVWVKTAACSTPPPAPPPSGDTTPPSQPSSLAVFGSTQTTVTLTWAASSDNVGVSGYGVYRNGSPASTVTQPGSSVSGLSCGTAYTFAVDAYDAAGNRSSKSSVTGTTAACSTPPPAPPPPGDTTPPSQPSSLAVSASTQTTVTLTWAASSDNVGVSGYGVYRNGTLVSTVTQPGSSVSGLVCGTAYSFAVDAYDAAGNRSSKSSVTGTTAACLDTQPPTAPASVQATSRTTTSIALGWSASSDNIGVVGYGLYKGGTLVGTTATTGWIFAGLACNTNYTLALDAYDAAANRSQKTTVLVSTTACIDTTPPSPPTNFAASNVTKTDLTLTWNASSDNVAVSGYDVYRNGTKMASVTSISSAQGGLTCGTSYWFGVEALDAAGNRSTRVNVNATTTSCAPPPPPSGTVWPSSFFTGPAGQNNILPPRQGVLTGIWDSGSVGTNQIKAREAQVGRKFDLGAGSYGTSTTANFDGKLTLIKNEGRIPVASMHSNHTIAQVNAGAEDAWHRASAQAVKALGVPTFVRLFHEFNGEWMPYYTPGDTTTDAQAFITAWRRVVSIWKSEGATNAVFVWHTANSNGANARVRYPGDVWVDWIASSNYTYAPIQWAGFYQDYADLWQLLGWAREYKLSDPSRYNTFGYMPFHDIFMKPFMIGEMGHFEDSRKASWFRNVKANLLGTFDTKANGGWPRVLALLYSDYGTEADANGETWTIDRPADGLAGFRDMVLDPYFNTRG